MKNVRGRLFAVRGFVGTSMLRVLPHPFKSHPCVSSRTKIACYEEADLKACVASLVCRAIFGLKPAHCNGRCSVVVAAIGLADHSGPSTPLRVAGRSLWRVTLHMCLAHYLDASLIAILFFFWVRPAADKNPTSSMG